MSKYKWIPRTYKVYIFASTSFIVSYNPNKDAKYTCLNEFESKWEHTKVM